MILLQASALDLGPLVRDGGAVAVLGIALVGAFREWWVPGWLYRKEVRRADRAEQIALKALGASEAVIEVIRQSPEESARGER